MTCTSIHRLMQRVGRGDRGPLWKRSTWSSGFSRLLIMLRYICTRDSLYHQKWFGDLGSRYDSGSSWSFSRCGCKEMISHFSHYWVDWRAWIGHRVWRPCKGNGSENLKEPILTFLCVLLLTINIFRLPPLPSPSWECSPLDLILYLVLVSWLSVQNMRFYTTQRYGVFLVGCMRYMYIVFILSAVEWECLQRSGEDEAGLGT